MTRTGGYNSVDMAGLDPTTWFGMDLLMFIGAGPAGTGGGIKVTTFAVLVLLVWTEIRGHDSVHAFGKRISSARSVRRSSSRRSARRSSPSARCC